MKLPTAHLRGAYIADAGILHVPGIFQKHGFTAVENVLILVVSESVAT